MLKSAPPLNEERPPVVKKSACLDDDQRRSREFLCEPRQSLLEVLRDTLELTGSKEGCNNGNCGACTVILDGVPVNSCLVLAVEAEGSQDRHRSKEWPISHLHPLQQCFLEGAALQCGICTPGLSCRRQGPARPQPETHRTRYSLRAGGQSLPLYRL